MDASRLVPVPNKVSIKRELGDDGPCECECRRVVWVPEREAVKIKSAILPPPSGPMSPTSPCDLVHDEQAPRRVCLLGLQGFTHLVDCSQCRKERNRRLCTRQRLAEKGQEGSIDDAVSFAEGKRKPGTRPLTMPETQFYSCTLYTADCRLQTVDTADPLLQGQPMTLAMFPDVLARYQ